MLDLPNDSVTSEAWQPFKKGRLMKTLADQIQIGKARTFRGEKWREAILYYLFALWGESKTLAKGKAEIDFGDVTLKRTKDEYVIYGTPTSPPPEVHISRCLPIPHPSLSDVEIALVRFVKSNRILQLSMRFRSGGVLRLTKGEKRGELLVSAYSVTDSHLPCCLEEVALERYSR